MSLSSKSLLSVVKFPIEGVGQGAGQSCSAPPRLPGPQTAPVLESVLPFSLNPFSLSHSSLHKSHAHISFPQSSVVNVHSNTLSPPASVSLTSALPHASSLFPNPFLLKQTLDLQPAYVPITKISTDSSKLPTSHVVPVVQLTSCPTTSSNSDSVTTTISSATRKPRKPRSDRMLTPNPLRPRVTSRVMAVDRIYSWRTPYGLSHDESLLAELPPALVESAKMSITGALATSSRSTYAAGLLRFNQFCDRWQISEGTCMPASYALLCAFIGNHKGATSGRTIKSWLSGIRAWHLINHAPWYGDDEWVQMARTSANREGSQHKRPLRAPVSIEHLLALRRALVLLSNPFHAAIWAIALVTFFGCRRLGETTVKSASSFDPGLHVLRSAEYV
jgi:hypothetical protein